MATILKPSYGAATTLTATVCNTLATSTSGLLLAGAQSSIVDNTTDLAVDALVGGTFTTGTTTANTVIEVWAGGSWDNGTTYLAGLGNGDSSTSPATNGLKRALKLLAVIDVTDTTARTFSFMASIAQAFGGTMPGHWHLFVTHNTGASFTAAVLKYRPIQYTNV